MNEEVNEALRRAQTHLRNSTLEGLEAVRALLEAAIHASGVSATSPDSIVSQLRDHLDDLISALRDHPSFVMPDAFGEPLRVALDAEIERWQQRAETDPDARLVLRAFLEMRALFWANSAHGDDAEKSTAPPPATSPRNTVRPKQKRVQRFRIED
ncbi:MAG: hypothetical protein VCB25_06705 [Myxococcota bacterium]